MKLPITVLVLTKNEEYAIQDCLASVKDCSQVIVVDSGSSDMTKEISARCGAEVVDFVWNYKYPKKKQWSLNLQMIDNEWVLFLDADERLSQNLVIELYEFFRRSDCGDFSVGEFSLDYYFMKKKLRYGHKVRKMALMKKGASNFPVIDDLDVKNMWEVEGHYQPKFKGKLFKFMNPIAHSDPDGLYDYFSRHNRYSDWEASLRTNLIMRQSVRESRSRQGAFFDRIPGKPIVFFFYSYILKLGFLDGSAGFNYAIALSFYYWQIHVKSKEMKNSA